MRSAVASRLIFLVIAFHALGACATGPSAPSIGSRASEGPGVSAGPSITHGLPAATATVIPGGLAGIRPIEGANMLRPEARDLEPTVGDDTTRRLAGSNAAFALDLYRDLAAQSDGNLILGPHSVSSSLTMLYIGARGDTAAEMAAVLHLEGEQAEVAPAFNALDLALTSRSLEGVVDLRLANQGFAAPGMPFIDAYLATLGRDFGAPMAELDFAESARATQVINAWAADRTNGRITELFPGDALSGNTVLVLANAVSMDAAWKYQFDPGQTRNMAFTLGDGSTAEVPTMQFDLYLPLSAQDDYDAVELPYGTGDLSMVVILPSDLDTFQAELDVDGLQQIFDAITEQGIHLSLPKFSFKSHTDLDDTLQRLGMTSIYGSADLSGMTTRDDLFLDTVQHEAFIEVDEEGTEAHAATGTAVAGSHGPTITFDRPFFFVIRDRITGAILFLGRVTDPRG